jgi:hypothetical protein
MKRKKYTQPGVVLFFLTLLSDFAYTQALPVELVFGHHNYYFQQSLSKQMQDNSSFGFFHTSSILIPYDKEKGNELMSQSYATCKIDRRFTAGIGTIYVPLGRFRPSAFLQFLKQGKRTTLLVFPRADLWGHPSFELMGFVEYLPAITHKLQLYTRVQLMTTWTLSEHSRSYQYLRLGVHLGKLQCGIAINYDEYGKNKQPRSNYGGFVRHIF